MKDLNQPTPGAGQPTPQTPPSHGQHPASSSPPKPEPELDRKARFAERVGISSRCLDNWLHDKKIPYLRVGKIVLIPWRDALAHLRRNYGINARGE
ncbi:hypothetical protein LBMAG56_41440 [Verrucomicrobiota bacterium]|nr:hypothetical protein LBMAG56_41440 [Verrucomicrobiota bacterium]